MPKIDFSFVIPAKNEEKSLEILTKEIQSTVKKLGKKYEIIFIDDGSTDNTFKVLKKIHKDKKNLKVVRLRGNWGKSVALKTGFQRAKGNLVFTLDADLQDDPKEIPNFVKKINEGYDLVSGWKRKRHDSVHTVILSRILNNFLIPRLTGVRLHDINCGFKAYKNDVIKSLNLYGELYRFIPIFVAKNNYRIAEIEINHRARKYGNSKYGITKNIRGLLDLITIVYLTKYLKRPGHFFGTGGMVFLSIGFLIGLYITYLRITTGGIAFHLPLLILGLLLMVVGAQLITTGLVAEMLTNFNQEKDSSENIILEELN